MSRIALQTLLESINPKGSVYYDPPASIQLTYPAIIYSRDSIDNTFADNTVYAQNFSYSITVMDKNPDSNLVKEISKLPTCRYDRHVVVDNLHHDIFTIYY